MGYYSSAYTVFMPLYSLCAASLPTAIAQIVSQSEALGQKVRIGAVKKAALTFFGALGAFCSLVCFFGAKIISAKIIGNPEAHYSVAIISISIFVGTITAVYRGLHEGLCNMAPTAVSQAVDSLVKLFSGLALAFWGKLQGYSLPIISALAILGTVIADVSGLLCLLPYSKGLPRIKFYDQKFLVKAELKRLLKLVAPIALAGLASSLLNAIDLSTIILLIKSSLKQNPWLYIEKYSAVFESGVELKELPNFLYGSFTGLAASIFTLVPSLCAVFGKSAFPRVAMLYAKKKKELVSKEIRRCMAICCYIALPAGFGVFFFARPILELLFKSRAAEISVTASPLSVLGLCTAFSAVLTACHFMLQAIGRQDLPIKITLAGGVLKLVLNTLLVPMPSLGLLGAAISTAVSTAFCCIWAVIALYKITETKPKILISVAIPTILGAFCCFGGWKLYQNMPQNRINALFAVGFSVLFAIITYVLTAVFLDISTKNSISAQFFEKNT